jgi:hypothetical protein
MAFGMKTGGRRKGSRNKASAQKAAAVAASGLTPLDYLLSVLRDEAVEPHVRLEAAKSAAPYLHPRLAPIGEHRAAVNVTANNAAVTTKQVMDDLYEIFGDALREVESEYPAGGPATGVGADN